MKRETSLACVGVLFALLGCGDPDTNESAPLANDPSSPTFDRTQTGPNMRSGENCLSCHRAGGLASSKPWSAAGTVFRAADSPVDDGAYGATITITDNAGKAVTLTSNAVGNFYTLEPLEKPLRMAIEYEGRRAEMPIPLDAQGACNGCHSHPDPIGGAKGRIRIP